MSIVDLLVYIWFGIGAISAIGVLLTIWYKDGVIMLVDYLMNRKKHVKDSVELGASIPSPALTATTYHRYDYDPMYFMGFRYGIGEGGIITMHLLFLAMLVPATCLYLFLAGPIYPVVRAHFFIHERFLQPEHIVLRLLKKEPELVATILQNPDHKYYREAKTMESAGSIKLNIAAGMVTIEGKTYKVETV